MGYKVYFEENVPVRALEIRREMVMNDFVEMGNEKERTIIKSLYIEAVSGPDAIKQATSIVRRIWGDVLS